MPSPNLARALRSRWVPLALVLSAGVVYGRVAGHEFLLNWDDLAYVVRNETAHGLTWENVRGAFAGPYYGHYAPLHLLSYGLDASLFGPRPAAFLLVNVAIHAANAVLLRALLLRLGLGAAGAAFAAAVFLLHPVQVESVAWISERKNVLAMTFSLAALHGFVRYRAAEGAARWPPYAGALLALVAALLTKVVAVVVPPALLLLDACDARRRPRRWLLDKVPFVAVAAAFALLTLRTQDVAIAEGRRAFWMDGPTTVFTMVPVLARYLGMLLWPGRLSAVYAPEIRESADAAFWGAVLLLGAVAAGGVLLWRRRREAVAPLAFFFVALAPVMHLVPLPTLMNDRYLYFPMLGAAALGGIALERLAAGAAPARRIAVAGAAAVALALGAGSFVRTGAWRDDLTLWRDVTEKTPASPFAWLQLGMAYADAGRPGDAVATYERGLRVDPLYGPTLNNLGALYQQLGRTVEARRLLRRAVEQTPASYEARMNLGVVEVVSGDLAAAERAFAAAVALRPDDPVARTALEDVRRAARAR